MSTSGMDALGVFNRSAQMYAFGHNGALVEFGVRTYGGTALVFEQRFPNELNAAAEQEPDADFKCVVEEEEEEEEVGSETIFGLARLASWPSFDLGGASKPFG